MPIIDTLMTRVQELRNNVLTQTTSLGGGILSNLTGGTGILSARMNLLNQRISAAKVQNVPIEKVKAFLNPEQPSFVPKVLVTGGVLSSFKLPSVSLPTAPTASKQILPLPPSTAPLKPMSSVIYA